MSETAQGGKSLDAKDSPSYEWKGMGNNEGRAL